MRHNKDKFPIIVPPQTFYSPSEKKGFVLRNTVRQMPRTVIFSCLVSIAFLILVIVVLVPSIWSNVPFQIPKGGVFFFLGLSAVLFILAVLQWLDIRDGRAWPGYRENVPPWFTALGGLALAIFGILGLLN